MTVDDFATYYSQCRKSKPTARGEQTAAEAVTAKDCTDSGVILCSTPVKNQNKQDINENPSEKTSLVARVERVAKEWFAPDDRMLRRRTAGKAFPVSLVACFVIIAVSMMLLVSGTVMVAGAKKDVSELKREVAKLSNEAQLLENEFESQIDYLEIYRVATEEYGMVDADFVCGSYLGSETDSYIEVYEKEDDATAGLATLLAAIGIHIGD
jgi:cell division protein FtsB